MLITTIFETLNGLVPNTADVGRSTSSYNITIMTLTTLYTFFSLAQPSRVLPISSPVRNQKLHFSIASLPRGAFESGSR